MKHKAHGLMFGFAVLLAAALVIMGCSDNDDTTEEKDTIGLHGGSFADKTNDLKGAFYVYTISITKGTLSAGSFSVGIPGITESEVSCTIAGNESDAAAIGVKLDAALAADTAVDASYTVSNSTGVVTLTPKATATKFATGIPTKTEGYGVTLAVATNPAVPAAGTDYPRNIWAVEITGTKALATLTATTTITSPAGASAITPATIAENKTAEEAAAALVTQIGTIANHTVQVITLGTKSFVALYKTDKSALTGVTGSIALAKTN